MQINKSLPNVADFQTTSITICESIQNMLTSEYGTEIKCEVTLMKKVSKHIKMVAYSNNDSKRPSSYAKEFSFDDEDIHFVELFKNLNGKISCLPDKKSVNEKFKKLKGSEEREKEICQYIGIPIKTNRNEIELLLQIDVSQKNVFGRNEEEVYMFARNILYPYAVLLHKAYERDLVFCRLRELVIKLQKNST